MTVKAPTDCDVTVQDGDGIRSLSVKAPTDCVVTVQDGDGIRRPSSTQSRAARRRTCYTVPA